MKEKSLRRTSPLILSISFDKIETIQNWPKLRKIKNIKVFLRFGNFYCCFIHNYSNIATLLI